MTHSHDPLPPTPGTIESYLEHIASIYDRKAEAIYVVINKEGTNVVKDPGLDRPWSSLHLKLAENVAREVGGRVVSLKDAIRLLGRAEEHRQRKRR